MLFIETEFPRPSAMSLAKFALRWWAYTNRDGTGLAVHHNGMVQIVKTKAGPKKMFKRNHIPNAKRFMGHVRDSTEGSVCDANAHPFYSCDGRSAFMHNGVLYNHTALRERLKSAGHKFTSTTDSEVMLHLGEEVGPEALMDKLKKEGVKGSANWIWMTPEKTFAYSAGSLYLVRDQLGLKVALFSDLAFAEEGFFKKAKSLPEGTLVIIENGRHRSKTTATIKEHFVWQGWKGWRDASGGLDLSDEAADRWWKTKSERKCDHGIRYDDRCVKCETFISPETEKTWFAPGDLFCKRCNVVYSEPTAHGQCSICYGRLLVVSDLQ